MNETVPTPVQLPAPESIQLYLGPLDGYRLQVSPDTAKRVYERGYVKVRQHYPTSGGGTLEVLELYVKAEDGKFRYMGRARE